MENTLLPLTLLGYDGVSYMLSVAMDGVETLETFYALFGPSEVASKSFSDWSLSDLRYNLVEAVSRSMFPVDLESFVLSQIYDTIPMREMPILFNGLALPLSVDVALDELSAHERPLFTVMILNYVPSDYSMFQSWWMKNYRVDLARVAEIDITDNIIEAIREIADGPLLGMPDLLDISSATPVAQENPFLYLGTSVDYDLVYNNSDSWWYWREYDIRQLKCYWDEAAPICARINTFAAWVDERIATVGAIPVYQKLFGIIEEAIYG